MKASFGGGVFNIHVGNLRQAPGRKPGAFHFVQAGRRGASICSTFLTSIIHRFPILAPGRSPLRNESRTRRPFSPFSRAQASALAKR
jgi:hypothetical protein